ncbi:MAG TPA: hypothetical protein VGM06_08665 [Polyangiaceae bacterium]|jgi:hypothetical protein
MSLKSKATRQNEIRHIIAGLDKHVAGVASVMLGGVDYDLGTLKALCQSDIDASDASVQARANLSAVVERERISHAKLDPLLRLLRAFVTARFGDTHEASDTLADFAMKPRASSKPSIATKAEAIDKGRATRAARHTMGPRQKAKIKGAPSGENGLAARVEASPPADPAPTPS